jgi:hypothetical protein
MSLATNLDDTGIDQFDISGSGDANERSEDCHKRVDITDKSTWPSHWKRWIQQPTEHYEGREYGSFDTLVLGPRGDVEVYSPPDGSGYAESYAYYMIIYEACFQEEMNRVVPEILDPSLAGHLGKEIGRSDVEEIVCRHRNGGDVSRAQKSGVVGWLKELYSRSVSFGLSPTISLRPTSRSPEHKIKI